MDVRRIAQEIEVAAREVRSSRAAMAIHYASQALLRMSVQLEMETSSDVWLVVGRSREDRPEDEIEWIVSINRDERAARDLARELTRMAGVAAGNLGRQDLFGLSQAERVSLKDMIGTNDQRARVGRHGLVWAIEPRKLD